MFHSKHDLQREIGKERLNCREWEGGSEKSHSGYTPYVEARESSVPTHLVEVCSW